MSTFGEPEADKPPAGVNPRAAQIWSHVIRRYADEIFARRDIAQQWKTARRFFERACTARAIAPYAPNPAAVIATSLRKLAGAMDIPDDLRERIDQLASEQGETAEAYAQQLYDGYTEALAKGETSPETTWHDWIMRCFNHQHD